jgi:hypothetical protein
MTEKNQNNSTFPSNLTVGIISGMIAIIVLAVISLVWWMMTPASPEEEIANQPTEAWPTPPPTFTPVATATPSAPPTPTATPTPIPPPTWAELGYLTTMEYTDRTMVDVERKKSLGIIAVSSDHILLAAVGKIQVGIDLTQIEAGDVEIKNKNLTVTIPRAKITSVELLPDQSKIYDQKQSWIFSQYEGIEIEALDKAKVQLTDQANKNQGILELAEKLGTLQLEDFLRKLGFEQIEIKFKDKEL